MALATTATPQTAAPRTATAMPRAATAAVRIRPKRTLLASGLLSYALVSIPVFTALYLLGIPLGTWPAILGFQLVTAIFAAACLWRYLTAFMCVDGGTILDRSFSAPLVRIPVDRVDRIVLVETYRWNAPDSVPQLLMLDTDGHRVDRLRGIFWREMDMRAFAAATGRPLTCFPEPITTQEFFVTYPTARYWFENRVVATVGALLALVAALFAVPWLMWLSGTALIGG